MFERLCCDTRTPILKKRVNEGCNSRARSKHDQPSEQNQPNNYWKKPKLFPFFHKCPQIHQELAHRSLQNFYATEKMVTVASTTTV
jgi:hypothetical protein